MTSRTKSIPDYVCSALTTFQFITKEQNLMRCCRLSRLPQLIAGLLFAILAVPLFAQPATPVHESHPFYDISKEVTLAGTVSSVLSRAPQGMMLGSHLLFETASGQVDGSLGKWGLVGKGALSVSAGQEVEVTGVMKTIRDKQVFVVRTVKAEGKVYVIRNEHGIPASPQSRERASQTTQKGETL
jgi:tetrahydromethanopterin S-methyltransferase subunit F